MDSMMFTQENHLPASDKRGFNSTSLEGTRFQRRLNVGQIPYLGGKHMPI